MTVSSTTSRIQIPGNGTTGPYSIVIEILAATHLLVRKVDANNAVTTLTDADYTVSAALDTITLTSSLADDEYLVVTRNVPLTQAVDFVNNGKLDVLELEEALDKLTMIAQQLDDEQSQVIGLPVTSSLANVSLPEPGAGEFLKWNADGDNLETGDPTGLIGLESVAADEAPVLGGDLDVNGNDIVSTSNADINFKPNGTGALSIGGNTTQSTPIRLKEDSDNGTNYIGLVAPSSVTTSYTIELPDQVPVAGDTLVVNSDGTSSWIPVSGRNLLATATASSSSSIAFTDLSSDYALYEIEVIGYKSSTNGQTIKLQTSTNNGSSYDAGASDYRYCERYVGSDGNAGANGDDANTHITLFTPGYVNSSYPTHFKVTIINPSAAQYCVVKWEGASEGYNGSTNRGFAVQGAGARLTAADVDAIKFTPSAGVITTGQFKVYGIN